MTRPTILIVGGKRDGERIEYLGRCPLLSGVKHVHHRLAYGQEFYAPEGVDIVARLVEAYEAWVRR
jgi:hypothetical protein